METKRLIIAVAISMVVLIAYQFLFMTKPQPPAQRIEPDQQPISSQSSPETTSTQPQESTTTQTPGEGPDIFSKKEKPVTTSTSPQVDAVSESLKGEEKDITIETDLFIAVFTTRGAGLKEFVLKKYNDDQGNPLNLISSKVSKKFGPNQFYPFYFSPFNVENLNLFLEINSQDFAYEGQNHITITADKDLSRRQEIVFKYADAEKNLSVEKRFTISSNSYVLEMSTQVVSEGKIIKDTPIIFGPGLENNVNEARVMQSPLRIGAYNGDKVLETVFSSLKTQPQEGDFEMAEGSIGSQFKWICYDTTYFAAIFRSTSNINFHMLKIKNSPEDKKGELYSYIIVNDPKFIFFGPKDEQILSAVEQVYGYTDLYRIVDYDWLIPGVGAIARLMLKGIILIYGIIPNYGWALVIFTIFIKILLFPLTYTSSVSMAKMQALQPKIKALKSKYKNPRDPEQRRKMQVEQMELFKKEKVNPAGGCLPLLLQMPILFAFFRLLPMSITFRHEPWLLWITDLSIKDPIYTLPILMGLTQIMVSKLSPTSADNTQKKMMYIMPVIMVVIFMNYSSGLNLYWFISNLLQMGQQYFINQKIFKERKEDEKSRKALKRKKGIKLP